jgi:signal transduction histidine kinase
VLCAHSTSHRAFSENDINFLQAVANVLGGAIERNEAQERLEEVREAERSRIARDLHDEALQDLSGAMAEAQLARRVRRDDPDLSERLERLSAALGRVEQRVRGAVYDLSLERERDRPFSELLRDLVELHRSMAPEQDISLEVRDGVLSGPLGSTGRELLRILGEALTNARQHSKARNVRVVVGTSGEILWAEVSDDGRGFDAAQEPPPPPPRAAWG